MRTADNILGLDPRVEPLLSVKPVGVAPVVELPHVGGALRRMPIPSQRADLAEELALNVNTLGETTFSILAAVCSVLDRHPDPLFIVDRHRKLRFRNLTAQRVLETRSGLSQREGCLSVGSFREDRRLEGLLAALQTEGASSRPQARGLRLHRSGAELGWCVIVHLLSRPVGVAGNSLFLLHPFSRMHARSTLGLLLYDLFGLTRAETAAILAVVKGGGVNNAARELSLSRETVRSHLKAVFRKCDVHSTLELAALIRAVSLFGGPDHRQEGRS